MAPRRDLDVVDRASGAVESRDRIRRELRRKRERVRKLASQPRPDSLGERMNLVMEIRAAKTELLTAWWSRYGSRVFIPHRERARRALDSVGTPSWRGDAA